MKLLRVLAIARKNLRGLKHDRRTVGFLVLMPLLMIAIFGYTFGGDVKNLEVIIFDLDPTPHNESLADSIINDILVHGSTFDVKGIHDSNAHIPESPDPITLAMQEVKDGHTYAVIIFDYNFTRDVLNSVQSTRNGTYSPPGNVDVYIDGTNPNIVAAILTGLQDSVQRGLVALHGQYLPSPVSVTPTLAYGQGARFIDFFAPGVMGLAAMMVTFMLSIISFVHERSASTLDRLLSTPVTEGEIVAGYALAFGVVALVQSIVILTAAVLLFQITIQGNVLLVLLMIFVFGVGSQGLGFVLSSVARTEFQAIQFLPLILFPSILLSGVFWPLEAVPSIIRPLSYFVPLTYAVEGLRSVMIRGWSVDGIWVQLLVLVTFAVVMLLLSTWALKRRR